MTPNALAPALLLLVTSSVACSGFDPPTAPTPLPTTESSVDMGDPADEARHALRGWGQINTGVSYPPEPGADRTSRYQLVRLPNYVELAVPRAAAPYLLGFRTQDGTCDDSFDVYVNDRGPLYRYRHRTSSDDFPIHQVAIPAEIVTSTIVNINFQNVAIDNCGFAAVYYVRLD